MRIAIFIDGDNLFYTQRDFLKWRIDFKRFLDYWATEGKVVEASYYTGQEKEESEGREGFLKSLASLGYRIVRRPVKENVLNGTRKVNLDTTIVRDICLSLDGFDFAVIVTGDSDFDCILETLRQRGKNYQIFSTQGCVANELKQTAGMYYKDLMQYRNQFEWVGGPAL